MFTEVMKSSQTVTSKPLVSWNRNRENVTNHPWMLARLQRIAIASCLVGIAAPWPWYKVDSMETSWHNIAFPSTVESQMCRIFQTHGRLWHPDRKGRLSFCCNFLSNAKMESALEKSVWSTSLTNVEWSTQSMFRRKLTNFLRQLSFIARNPYDEFWRKK